MVQHIHHIDRRVACHVQGDRSLTCTSIAVTEVALHIIDLLADDAEETDAFACTHGRYAFKESNIGGRRCKHSGDGG